MKETLRCPGSLVEASYRLSSEKAKFYSNTEVFNLVMAIFGVKIAQKHISGVL